MDESKKKDIEKSPGKLRMPYVMKQFCNIKYPTKKESQRVCVKFHL
jgi:hypothetical protein